MGFYAFGFGSLRCLGLDLGLEGWEFKVLGAGYRV